MDRGRLGRHWCLGFAALAQLPTRVHTQVLRARPNHHPADRRSSGATCRPSTSAMSVIHEHDQRTVRPRHICDGKPPQDEQYLPCRRYQPDGHSSGVSQAPEGPSTPASTSAAEVDIPQPASSGHPLSLVDTLGSLETATNSHRTEPGLSSRSVNSPDPPSRSPMSPIGPPPTATRENDDGQPHPRCLPPPAPVPENLG